MDPKPSTKLLAHVWIVSELYYPEDTSTGHFLTRIAEGLAQSFSVSVLTVQPTYSRLDITAPRIEKRNNVDVFRLLTTRLNRHRFLGRAINTLSICAMVFVYSLAKFRKGEVVFVVTNPPVLPAFVALACAVRKSSLVLVVHDVFPDTAAATGILNEKGVAFKILSRLSKWVAKRSTFIVTLGRDMDALFRRRFGVTNTEIIEHWSDTSDIFPLPESQNPFVSDPPFLLGYAGNVGRTHDLDILLQALGDLKDESVRCLLCASGVQYDKLQKTLAGNPSITLLERVPRNRLNALLNAASVNVISFKEGMCGLSTPSRFYNLLACGKPILAVCDADTELALAITRHEVGWVVTPGDIAGLRATIESIAAVHPETLQAYGQRALKAAREIYTFESTLQKYKGVVERSIRMVT